MIQEPEEWDRGAEIMSVLIFSIKKREPHKSFPFLGGLAREWEAGFETPSLLGRMTDCGLPGSKDPVILFAQGPGFLWPHPLLLSRSPLYSHQRVL